MSERAENGPSLRMRRLLQACKNQSFAQGSIRAVNHWPICKPRSCWYGRFHWTCHEFFLRL